MIKLLTSTRFVGLLTSLVIFVILTLTTKYPPMELSGAIAVLYGIYVTGRTVSNLKEEKSTPSN